MSAVIDDIDTIKQKLEPWLLERLREEFGSTLSDVQILAIEKLQGGQSSDMMALSFRYQTDLGASRRDCILRREPRDKQLFLTPDVVREAKVIRGVEAQKTVAVPHVYWIEPGDRLLGAPFFIMGRVEGIVPLARPSMHLGGLLPTLSVCQRETLWRSAMNALVGIHNLDADGFRFLAGEAGNGTNYLAEYVAQLEQWYAWATQGKTYPITEAALNYLKDGVGDIIQGQAVLLWNDARVGNMLFDENYHVAAVLDWENAILGPAGLDLGYWMMMDEFHAEAIGVERLRGWPGPEETQAFYQEASGRTIKDINYFIVLAAFYIAITLIRQADVAIEQGRLKPDSRMGYDNTCTQIIARRLGLPVPKLSDDFIAHRKLESLISSS